MKVKKLQINKSLLLALLATLSIGLTGCGKKSDCEIKGFHLHKYEKEGIIRYLPREELSYQGYNWTDNIVYVNEGEEDLYKFEQKKKLLKIKDNEDYLQSVVDSNHDFIEYRYAYTYLMPIVHTMRSGKSTITYTTLIPMTHYSWTTDPNHSRLTGETRVCHHVYTAYKVEKNEKGKYVLVESPQVDDILTLKNEYPYFKEKFTTIIDLKDRQEVDYEDGQNDDEENIMTDEETENYEEGKEYKKVK